MADSRVRRVTKGSPQTLGGALYSLARYPPDLYLDPIRKEIEEVVESEGWSKESMAKMVKLDAFLRETLRVYDPQLSEPAISSLFLCSPSRSAYREDGLEGCIFVRWHLFASRVCNSGKRLGAPP